MENSKQKLSVIRPITLLLLDFQMPIKNAIQAILELRKFFRFIIENEEEFQILEPNYVILTAFATPSFK